MAESISSAEVSPSDLRVVSAGERRLRLARGLSRVRWFGVAFAFFQIVMGTDPLCPAGTIRPVDCEPIWLRPIGYSIAAGLGVANLALVLWLRKTPSEKSVRWAGVAMFIVDHLFLIAFCWLYSFGENTTIWIVLYILPLEGALRWGMGGALVSLAILFPAEIVRDLYRQEVWGFDFTLVPNTSFRLGIMLIIGLFAGMMARNLQNERAEVENRAALLSELARREAAARRELEMFHEATMAGVSTGDFEQAMERMITTIGEKSGFESLALGMLVDHPDGQRVRVVAGYRYPRDIVGREIALDEGVCGPVARTGVPALVADVTEHTGYLEFAPWARSEMAAALQIGERIIGVLNVESSLKGAFGPQDLEKLGRLAAPLALVVENARILATEKETVERLTELDTMKSDFITITSHELRTPLTAIRGFVQTLLRPDINPTPEQLRNYLEVVDRQSERLHSMIEDLGLISQLEAGTLEFRPSSVDLCELIQSVVDEDHSNDRTRILLDCESPSPLLTDESRIRKVVGALITNALEFSPAHSPVQVRVREVVGATQMIVSDQGIGIPETEKERIFDRFHQVGGSMRRHKSGFGLGLYMARRIVETLGGHIAVESQPGQGSTFVVNLPQAGAESAA
ncbi:MAG: ATP-binding protein [Actinomycetota bacterium]